VELTSLHYYPRKVGERQKNMTKFLQAAPGGFVLDALAHP
jgi:hypothetical protein